MTNSINEQSGAQNDLDIQSVLARLDRSAVAESARKESRNREVHYPPLSVFRWWARRTGAVNAALMESASAHFGKSKLMILDPFVGGGTIPLMALLAGHHVQGQDINPWAVAGVQQMLAIPGDSEIEAGYQLLTEAARDLTQSAYATVNRHGESAELMHTYRVATSKCIRCTEKVLLFPYSLLTLRKRRESGGVEALLACPEGHIFSARCDETQRCPHCARSTDPRRMYTPRRIFTCPHCENSASLSDHASAGNWKWEVVLVQRSCNGVREFDAPTEGELKQADSGWSPTRKLGAIPTGSETNVLLRHGYSEWSDLYPKRQLFVTEQLLELVDEVVSEVSVANALKMAIVGTTEFSGHLCRWDRYYLKLNDATAGHRFNFSTFVPELNVVGVGLSGRGTLNRRVASLKKAAKWLDERGIGQKVVATRPPMSKKDDLHTEVRITLGDSRFVEGASSRFDLVLTDPPYHDDVQYSELSLLFRTWTGQDDVELTGEASTSHVASRNSERGSYGEALEPIFSECRRVLKPEGRLIFSYANGNPDAWVELFSALQAAGFFAVACLSVHSENETDFKKRDVKAHVEDLILELSPRQTPCQGKVLEEDRLDPFMSGVAELFSQVGSLQEGWEVPALRLLRDQLEG